MNILVWSSYVKRPAGGMERIALEIALGLHRHGHRVVLVGAYDNAPELRAKIPAAMPYYFFDMHRRRVKPHVRAARLLWQLSGKHQIQIVSAHGSVFAVDRICLWRGMPMVWTIHGTEPRPGGVVGRLKTLALSRLLSHAHVHVVAVSEATAESIRQQFPQVCPQRLHVIHNGAVDEESLRALPLPQAGPPWRLGFVGRLVERKRPLDLVETAKRLEGKLEFRFEVFGAGPLLQPMQRAIAAARLQQRFTLHGWCEKGSAAMIGQFQILVHPDSVEPFGGAVLESQLGGRPVAAYRVGGNPEIVEDGRTGFLVPLADTAALAEAVRTLAGAGFAEFCRAARQRAAERFSLKQMIGRYEWLLQQLCGSTPAPPAAKVEPVRCTKR